jgi:hypothetical protein
MVAENGNGLCGEKDSAGRGEWEWQTLISSRDITENKCHTYKKEFKLKTLFTQKKLHARLFFKYYSLHPKI